MADDWYTWVKALHVIAVIAWMAGMLYLPRLFVYHADAVPGSEQSETFKVMERRLMRAIINPAMVVVWVLGVVMLFAGDRIDFAHDIWIHVKLVLVLAMSGLHGAFSKWRKDFEADRNTRSARFYRVMNEAPTLLLIAIVILAVVKPF